MKELSDKKIISAWRKNVSPWINAIRNEEIESRLLVTNQSVFDVVNMRAPKTVLDLGCGEGWLVRKLSTQAVDCLGIDVVPELIEYAQQQGVGRFKIQAYEDLSVMNLREKFDVVVSNFALLGKESVEHVFTQIPDLLEVGGAFIIQTIHPVIACGNEEYKDAWRKGSWDGFNEDFSDAAPWYFRTMESWGKMFEENGFRLSSILEPLNPQTARAASVIFVGELVAQDLGSGL